MVRQAHSVRCTRAAGACLPEVMADGCWCFRHCVDLFLDFITIFRKLMVILAMNDKVTPPSSCLSRLVPLNDGFH